MNIRTWIAALLLATAATALLPVVARADHWSTGVSTHDKGPVVLPGESTGMISRIGYGTRRVVGTGIKVVATGVQLPFKLTAAAVRSFRSDGEPSVARGRSDSSSGLASMQNRNEPAGQARTVTEWMRQPRPQ